VADVLWAPVLPLTAPPLGLAPLAVVVLVGLSSASMAIRSH
jgi:hypothetical protein